MLKKLLYEAPEAELLDVRFEGNFCNTNDGKPGDDDNLDDDQNIY